MDYLKPEPANENEVWVVINATLTRLTFIASGLLKADGIKDAIQSTDFHAADSRPW
jgi:hypothetical protein